MRERLVEAVLSGAKTATSALLAEADCDELPRVGDRLALVDSEERPVAVIELTAVDVIRLGDADLSLTEDEGEGYNSVNEWRREHERFWREGGFADPLTDDTRIVVERFRLVNSA
jgi:uncharacterized protein YhfF